MIFIPFSIDRFSFQTDDGFVLLDVCRQGIHTDALNWMVYDFINKKVTFVTISHTHCESGLCDMKNIKIIQIGDETGFVQVSTAAIAGGMVVPITSCVFVFQNKPITQVDFENWSVVRTWSSMEILE